MNTMIKEFMSIVMTHKKRIATIGIILLTFLLVLSYVYGFSSEDSKSEIISGRIFIDGQPAPFGTNVSIAFHDGYILKTEGTNETGVYHADVTDFSGQSFKVYVYIDGLSYIGTDESGFILNITLVDDMDESINVYVDTTDNNNFDDSENDESNDDDGSDDTGDSGSDDQDDSGSDNSDNNDDDGSDDDSGDSDGGGSDDGGDNGGGGGGGSGGDDNNDNSDDSDDNESEDDTPSDDGDQENESYFLAVEKLVWNSIDSEWSKQETVDLNEIVHFKLTVTYNGSNISLIQLSDILPDGLLFYGNITVDDSVFEPANDPTQELEWNVSAVSNQNTTFHILYNASVLQKDTFENSVTVQMIHNDTVVVEKESNATVYVYGDLLVSSAVKQIDENTWDDTITVDIGETVRCKVSIDYNGSNVLSTLSIVDKLPNGLEYIGNATMNGQLVTPDIVEDNQTIIYNLTMVQSFETIIFEFDVTVTENASMENNVTVSATESTGKQFDIVKTTTVIGKEIQLLNCRKKVKVEGTKWKENVNALVNDTASFQVTVTNYDAISLYNLAIVDTMPSALEYVSGSAVLYYENHTLYKEPVIDYERNQYFWIDINKVNFDPNETGYFTFNDTIILEYDVNIIAPGLLVNTVAVNSSPCGTGCEPLTGKDSAMINATVPIDPLTVGIVVSTPVYVGEIVQVSVDVEGGVPPYNFTWDFDNDGNYIDSYEQSLEMIWESEGTYLIRVNVTDNASVRSTASKEIVVSFEPLYADAGGPFYCEPDELVHFEGFASGGYGNYSWFWDFDDGTVSTVQHPQHAFSEEKEYYITLNVTDERNETVSDMTIVYCEEPDNEPPMIILDSPRDALYVRNREMVPFFTSFIIGNLDINITAVDNDSSVEKIELYINSELIYTSSSDSLNYHWNEQVFGKQSIIIKAFDAKDNWRFYEKHVWKFF